MRRKMEAIEFIRKKKSIPRCLLLGCLSVTFEIVHTLILVCRHLSLNPSLSLMRLFATEGIKGCWNSVHGSPI